MLASISSVSPTGPLSWRWPEEVEHFSQGWDFTAMLGGRPVSMRHALGRREVFGRSRVHSVTWIGQNVAVEGNAADDYPSSRCLISLLRQRGGMRHIRSVADVPPVYNTFRVVNHQAEMTAPHVPNSLAVKVKEDDLAAWATHALWRRNPELFPNGVHPPPPLRPYPPLPPDIVTTVTTPTSRNVVIGAWRLLQLLGQGAFGVVWLAEHVEARGMLRALKFVINQELAHTIRREADRLVRIEHAAIDYRHIARLMEIVSLDPPCLAYEFINGESLLALVHHNGAPLTPNLAGNILDQVLSGLYEVDRAGLVHRDLHPGNIMIIGQENDPLVKILDFGLAYPQENANNPARAFSGLSLEPSHPWAEPAYLRGQALPDARTDLYSAGVLLWWMLTGSQGLPAGRGLQDAAPMMAPALLQIVRRACIDPRSARYAGALAMQQELREAFTPRPAPQPDRR